MRVRNEILDNRSTVFQTHIAYHLGVIHSSQLGQPNLFNTPVCTLGGLLDLMCGDTYRLFLMRNQGNSYTIRRGYYIGFLSCLCCIAVVEYINLWCCLLCKVWLHFDGGIMVICVAFY